MSLVQKFLALFLVLGAVVAFNIAVGVWTLQTLQREFAGPLADVQRTMVALHHLKRGVENVGEAMRRAGADEPLSGTRRFGADRPGETLAPHQARDELVRRLDESRQALAAVVAIDALRLRAGASTPRNLSDRLATADAAARRWLESGNDQDAREAGVTLYEIHEFVERIEGRVLDVAADETSYQARLGRLVWSVLGASLAGMILAIALATQLVRRWIMSPIQGLRDAAAEYARGNFAYRTNVQSGDEIGQLAGEVNHMAGVITSMQEERIARERLAAMGELVRRLVHNLRNPLAGIRSLAELTRDELDESQEPERSLREHQNRIVRTIDGFERWLRDLLETTRPLELQPVAVEIAPWLRTVLEPLDLLARSRGVRIELDTDQAPTTAVLDPKHLDHAIVGIVTNAIQASPDAGCVKVRADKAESDYEWSLEVSDQGQGVPPTIRDKIFLPHFTTKPDGTGTGLAVAKQVVEQHGGRIWVENGPDSAGKHGSGALFRLRLPLRRGEVLATIGQKRGPD